MQRTQFNKEAALFAITEHVRTIAREWPVPYRFWLGRHSRKIGKPKKLPEMTDSIYLDGYPRSGNTYFTALVRQLEPQVKFADHLHVVAPIKIALSLKIPTFILMRNPDDAILSYMVHIEQLGVKSGKRNLNPNELAGQLTSDWLRYYRFVDSYFSRLTVVLSEAAFKDPLGTIENVFELAGVQKDPYRSAKFEKAHRRFATRDATKAQGSTSYPSAERNRLKDSYRAICEKSGKVEEARQLHRRIAARVLSAQSQRLS